MKKYIFKTVLIFSLLSIIILSLQLLILYREGKEIELRLQSCTEKLVKIENFMTEIKSDKKTCDINESEYLGEYVTNCYVTLTNDFNLNNSRIKELLIPIINTKIKSQIRERNNVIKDFNEFKGEFCNEEKRND